MRYEYTSTLPRQPDADALYMHFTGGLRAAKANENDAWIVEPIIQDGLPHRAGFFTSSELEAFTRKMGFQAIAFHTIQWNSGKYSSSWSPLIPGQSNHSRGPSDLWGSVASNMTSKRISALRESSNFNRDEIAKVIDERTREELLALSISLSLRSMDISIEQIVEFYHEQLVDVLAAGVINGRRFGSIQDQNLYAHIHSFLVHFGSARDYLAALIATRINKKEKIESQQKLDSLNNLIKALEPKHFGVDALLDLLKNRQLLQRAENQKNYEASGWLKEASSLRNKFVHRQPYGSRHVEGYGHAEQVAADVGIYRYVRPVLFDDNLERDVLDVVVDIYMKVTELFHAMAETSGLNTEILAITRGDITAIALTKS
jgi:hypothetical protein